MKRGGVLLLSLGLLVALPAGHTLAGDKYYSTEEYMSSMKSGKCWGKCAYRPTLGECISCGLSYHGVEHKKAVLYYCEHLQPKCGH